MAKPFQIAERAQTLFRFRAGMNRAPDFGPQISRQAFARQPEETQHFPVHLQLPKTGLPAPEKQVPGESNVRFQVLGERV